jgi:hypothetical protein
MYMSSRTGNPGSKDQEGVHSSGLCKDAVIQKELTISLYIPQQKGVEEATSDQDSSRSCKEAKTQREFTQRTNKDKYFNYHFMHICLFK